MKLKVVCQCPPIPTHNYDWVCYDEDTYDMTDYDGETVQFVSSCSIGNGCTEEEAIINFVYTLIDDAGISVTEMMGGPQ